MDLSAKIEALLFYKGEPLSRKELGTILKSDQKEIEGALLLLRDALGGRGLTLIENDDEVSLTTDKEASELIGEITKEELQKDLGKASLETLTVVLYKGPVSKSEIDYIRGVNSSFILRNLLIRGLIKRAPHALDKRAFVYSPTIELLSYLGISKTNELPEYNEMRTKIDTFEKNFKETHKE
jgi:segregation and condensation protein B